MILPNRGPGRPPGIHTTVAYPRGKPCGSM